MYFTITINNIMYDYITIKYTTLTTHIKYTIKCMISV